MFWAGLYDVHMCIVMYACKLGINCMQNKRTIDRSVVYVHVHVLSINTWPVCINSSNAYKCTNFHATLDIHRNATSTGLLCHSLQPRPSAAPLRAHALCLLRSLLIHCYQPSSGQTQRATSSSDPSREAVHTVSLSRLLNEKPTCHLKPGDDKSTTNVGVSLLYNYIRIQCIVYTVWVL